MIEPVKDMLADTLKNCSLKQITRGMKCKYEEPTMTVTAQSQGLRLA